MIRVRLQGFSYYYDMDLDEAITPDLSSDYGEGVLETLERGLKETVKLNTQLILLLVDKKLLTVEEAVLMVRPGVRVSILEEDE